MSLELGPLRLQGPGATDAVGRLLGGRAEPGFFYALSGALGAGKTTLAQGILSGAGVEAVGGSPSFLIVRTYRGRLTVYHVDLYRLGEGAAGEPLGWEEILEGEGLAVVEWAEYLRPLWPAEYLWLRLERPEGAEGYRLLRLEAAGGTYERLAREVAAAC
ncbi:MAG: tRNA (adenosine(37)-N6)-threonylcarbamoyltransferase complex ATPase subunit type 1 TsaE [Bacillota bacterium]|nr:tRNA (adenosine(37)-N6)-threonylcarbamoyltransferase complex ATPase subunit type 1 TsaE [Bacillota bacterium]MDI3317657.1 tRNA (adenosine(37)-N6)-threonylcarbamoyltransferase complex ATPase subunit type 1 TsaE [Bacillota bacterium]